MNIYVYQGSVKIATFPQMKTDQVTIMREVGKLKKKYPRFDIDYSEFEDCWTQEEFSRWEEESDELR